MFGVKQAQAEVGVRQPGIIYQTDEPNHPKLRLVKLASCGHALPGEEVEFTLRFDNIGDQVIGNVTIVDNLSTRLEYVPESAKSSVDADFITQVERRRLAHSPLGNQRPGEAGRRRHPAIPREGAVGAVPSGSAPLRVAAKPQAVGTRVRWVIVFLCVWRLTASKKRNDGPTRPTIERRLGSRRRDLPTRAVRSVSLPPGVEPAANGPSQSPQS